MNQPLTSMITINQPLQWANACLPSPFTTHSPSIRRCRWLDALARSAGSASFKAYRCGGKTRTRGTTGDAERWVGPVRIHVYTYMCLNIYIEYASVYLCLENDGYEFLSFAYCTYMCTCLIRKNGSGFKQPSKYKPMKCQSTVMSRTSYVLLLATSCMANQLSYHLSCQISLTWATVVEASTG